MTIIMPSCIYLKTPQFDLGQKLFSPLSTMKRDIRWAMSNQNIPKNHEIQVFFCVMP